MNFLTIWDYIGVAAYLGALAWMGVHFSRKQRDTDRYFVAHRSMPGWAVGISIFATLLSSFTFIAFPGWTFDRSWEILMREFMAPFAIFFAAILIIPLYRRVIRMSAYEYLEKRYGYLARLYGVLGFILGHLFKISVVLFTMAVALNGITGWNIFGIIVVLGIITVLYTTFGGIEGVVWTDVVQGLLMLGSGLLAIAFLLFFASPQPASEVFSNAFQQGKFRLVDTEFTWQAQTVWVFVAFGIFHFITKYATDQTMVQRYLLAPTIASTVRALIVSILCCLAAWTMFSLIGTLLFSFYDLNPQLIPADFQVRGDRMFPLFIGSQLPPFITGIVLAGLIAATMSTLSSDLNSLSAVGVSDFYDRFASAPTEAKRLAISKGITFVSGIFTVILGVFLVNYSDQGIMKLTLDVAGILGGAITGGLLAMFGLGFFSRRTNWKGLYVGLAAGFLFSLWCTLTKTGFITTASLAAEGKPPLVTLPEGLGFLVFTPLLWWLPIFSNLLVLGVTYVFSLILDPRYRASDELIVTGIGELFAKEAEREEKPPTAAPQPSGSR